jgi:hypothetical protein
MILMWESEKGLGVEKIVILFINPEFPLSEAPSKSSCS